MLFSLSFALMTSTGFFSLSKFIDVYCDRFVFIIVAGSRNKTNHTIYNLFGSHSTKDNETQKAPCCRMLNATRRRGETSAKIV